MSEELVTEWDGAHSFRPAESKKFVCDCGNTVIVTGYQYGDDEYVCNSIFVDVVCAKCNKEMVVMKDEGNSNTDGKP